MKQTEEILRAYAEKFASQQEELYQNAIPDAEAADWMLENVPLLRCPDPEIEEVYYFRWWTFRKHLVRTPEGWVITEFLPKVKWSGPYNAIVCPIGHHIREARWLRDKTIVRDDIRFYLRPENEETALKYSNSLLAETCALCLSEHDEAFAEEVLPALEHLFVRWEQTHLTGHGLYWSCDDRDGMEYSVSGSGLRPTLNAYQYGAAAGLAELCRMLGRPQAEAYAEKAEALGANIRARLWDERDGFFKTVPMATMDFAPDWLRGAASRNVKEEIGFIPFTYPGLTDRTQESAFRCLTDSDHFLAPWGITTADMASPYFMKNPAHHECLWDGPVWPFATSQTLTALYTVLRDHESAYITPKDYMSLLRQYASSHILEENRKTIRWIDEDQDPFTGRWIARELIKLDHAYGIKAPIERGGNYNHSTFCDLVLSGACGISAGQPSVHPLADWKEFSVQNIRLSDRVYNITCTDGKADIRAVQ